MTLKRITIVLAAAFIVAMVTVGVILWHNSATAQPPDPFGRRLEEVTGLRSRFPVSEVPAICTAGDYVYVVAGNTLYKFDAADLKLINKTPIETEPRFRPDRPGRMEEPFPPSRKTPEIEEGK